MSKGVFRGTGLRLAAAIALALSLLLLPTLPAGALASKEAKKGSALRSGRSHKPHRHHHHHRYKHRRRHRRSHRIAEAEAHRLGYSLTPSKTEPYAACPPKLGAMACDSVIVPPGAIGKNGVSPSLQGSGEKGGFSPQDLQSAYNVSSSGGEGRTVAIVSAYDDPHANADLKVFREKYGLPPCTEENGCFKKLNQYGEEGNYSVENSSWALETSLDLDMASAMCPNCHLLLVETNNNFEGFDEAEEIAATAPGTTVVSNSWGGPDNSYVPPPNSPYNHPGIPILFASGDSGYGNCSFIGHASTCAPASYEYVVAVGGTRLEKAENSRGWTEKAWGGAGSGCSEFQPKPSWQTDPGCPNRMVADVSAVADFQNSPVSVYNQGWKLVGGTSASAPIVAGILAQASKAVREQGPEAFYRHPLYDVMSTSSACSDLYLCSTKEGYDAHTGWGTPNGPLATTLGLSAVTSEATNLTETGATLNGYVDPEGLTTTYRFEYGPTTSYGFSVPASGGSAGSGAALKAVSQSITGLEQAATYHYRLMATNSSGTVYGKDHMFGTLPWSLESMPKPAETAKESYKGSTSGASCYSASTCFAVGSYTNSSKAEVTLAERWNGTEWAIEPSAKPAEATSSQLQATSCPPTSTSCTAVGSYYKAGTELTLAEARSGESWSVQPTPNPAGAKSSKLQAVSCVTTKFCMAVGSYINSAGTEATLAERWSSGAWTIVSTPGMGETKGTGLQGISCLSSTDCTAVGFNKPTSKSIPAPLAEHWNGTEWSVQSTPTLPEGESGSLRSVSCSSSSACMAIGSYAGSAAKTLAERWNGSAWSLQSMPSNAVWPSESSYLTATFSSLNSVSCPAAFHCIAVGTVIRQAELTPLVESWNGLEWTVQEGRRPAASATLNGIACATPFTCITAGYKWVTDEEYEHTIPWAEYSDQPLRGGAYVESMSPVLGPSGFATLKAKVYAGGLSTTYQFEYGTTTAYGNKAPVSPKSVGSGMGPVEVSEGISGLSPNTAYHYRIVAENSVGVVQGPDGEFVTGAVPANQTLPVITPSTPAQAAPVSITTGKWSGAPTSWAYQWKRCNASGGECTAIKGATESTYTPTSTDVGSTLVTEVTAKNSEGSGTASSAPSAKVKALGAISEYSLPSGGVLTGIATGFDGKLWFTETETGKIGKITTSGTVTEYALTNKESYPTGIAAGSDGNLWFTETETGKIGKITTSGTITEYSLPVGQSPWDIAAGPESALWFTSDPPSKIGKITTSGTITEYAIAKGSMPREITSGPDGNLWFTNLGTSKIGKMTKYGEVTEYALANKNSYPTGIAAGPDGNLWFTNRGTSKIGKITTSGTITEYSLPAGSSPAGIATGPDGNLWIAEEGTSMIGRVTPSGTVTNYSLPGGSGPYGITAGPDGMMWFTFTASYASSKIGVIAP